MSRAASQNPINKFHSIVHRQGEALRLRVVSWWVWHVVRVLWCGTTKLPTKRWEQIFEFLPPEFFRAPQSQKTILKKIFRLWKALKKILG